MDNKLQQMISDIEKLVDEANKYSQTTSQGVDLSFYVDSWESFNEEWADSGCEWSSSSEDC